MSPMQILDRLSEEELVAEATSTHYPKWNTLCLMRSLGLPTLDAVFIPPESAKLKVGSAIKEFSRMLGTDRVLVRSDGGREVVQYARGGNTVDISAAIAIATKHLNDGRAVILLEPTNRFQNQLTANILAGRDGRFCIEILGPGYDTADLNRGRVCPQNIISCDVPSWDEHRELSIIDVSFSQPPYSPIKRRRMRLNHLGADILPAARIRVGGNPERFAERWLRKQGYTDLWSDWTYCFDLRQCQEWYDDTLLVAQYHNRLRSWDTLILSWSKLPDRRAIYWDVVDSHLKYKLPSK